MKKIQFHFERTCSLQRRNKLKAFLIEKCLINHDYTIDIQYIFVSDPYLLDINRRYLQHDYLTDIITFDNSTDPSHLTAEIYISVDRVKDNAIQYNVTFEHELHRVMFHGLLHLLGYEDTTPELKHRMSEHENQWLDAYFEAS